MLDRAINDVDESRIAVRFYEALFWKIAVAFEGIPYALDDAVMSEKLQSACGAYNRIS
jgi:hypothetical protein